METNTDLCSASSLVHTFIYARLHFHLKCKLQWLVCSHLLCSTLEYVRNIYICNLGGSRKSRRWRVYRKTDSQYRVMWSSWNTAMLSVYLLSLNNDNCLLTSVQCSVNPTIQTTSLGESPLACFPLSARDHSRHRHQPQLRPDAHIFTFPEHNHFTLHND